MGTVEQKQEQLALKEPTRSGPLELIWPTASCFGRLRGETEPQSAPINTILVSLIFRSRRGKGNSWLSQILLGERENSRLASGLWGLLPEGLSARLTYTTTVWP